MLFRHHRRAAAETSSPQTDPVVVREVEAGPRRWVLELTGGVQARVEYHFQPEAQIPEKVVVDGACVAWRREVYDFSNYQLELPVPGGLVSGSLVTIHPDYFRHRRRHEAVLFPGALMAMDAHGNPMRMVRLVVNGQKVYTHRAAIRALPIPASAPEPDSTSLPLPASPVAPSAEVLPLPSISGEASGG